jgi:hypothetical protein
VTANSRALGAAAAAIASAALLGGCGGTGADFVSNADGVCTDAARGVNAVFSDGGTPTSGPEAAAQASLLLPIERRALTDLRAIEPPRERAAAYRRFLSARERALALTERQREAAESGDPGVYDSLGERRDQVNREADQDAVRAGLRACGERLAPEEVRAVSAAIRRAATATGPALCTEAFTANFVRSEFGGLAGCRRRQSDPAAAADSVRISAVRGIDSVYALAIIVPSGGSSGGQRLRTSLLYSGGAYRADSIGPAPG